MNIEINNGKAVIDGIEYAPVGVEKDVEQPPHKDKFKEFIQLCGDIIVIKGNDKELVCNEDGSFCFKKRTEEDEEDEEDCAWEVTTLDKIDIGDVYCIFGIGTDVHHYDFCVGKTNAFLISQYLGCSDNTHCIGSLNRSRTVSSKVVRFLR